MCIQINLGCNWFYIGIKRRNVTFGLWLFCVPCWPVCKWLILHFCIFRTRRSFYLKFWPVIRIIRGIKKHPPFSILMVGNFFSLVARFFKECCHERERRLDTQLPTMLEILTNCGNHLISLLKFFFSPDWGRFHRPNFREKIFNINEKQGNVVLIFLTYFFIFISSIKKNHFKRFLEEK